MNYSIVILFSFILLSTSCVKEDGEISTGGTVTTTGGGTSGGEMEVPGTPDPLASQAWHLENSGQTSFSSGTGVPGEDISLTGAIAAGFTGAGIRIAVSDSGTDIDHNDLTGTQLVGEHRNYGISDSAQWRTTLPYVIGNDAHGTAVAGLIAAEANNGIGSRGVAPDAKYAAFRYIGDYTFDAASYLARTIDQADGDFDIFNYSYGYGQCYFVDTDALEIEAFEYGVNSLRDGKGTLYVQSAGNSYMDYVGDCLGDGSLLEFAGNTNSSDDLSIPEKIIVGAVNADGVKSSYSTPGSGIWVSAPGGEYGSSSPAMVTTDITGCGNGYSRLTYALNEFNRGSALNTQCDYTSLMNGTSSAAPVTTGVIALMLQAQPNLTWRDVKHILALTADEVDYSLVEELDHPWGEDLASHVYDMKWIQNAAGIDYSNWYGFGRINALSAVLMATAYDFPLGAYEKTSNPRTDAWYYSSGVIATAIPDNSATGTAINATTQISVKHNFFIESVQLKVNITHARPQDLAISLISPSGTESKMMLVNSGLVDLAFPVDKLLMTNAFYGEDSYGAGSWTIRVIDGKSGTSGTLTKWSIRINGHRITGDGSYPNAPTALVAAASYPSATLTPPVAFTYSGSGDVMRYEMSVGTAPGLSNVGAWTSVGMNNVNAQLTDLALSDATNYYVNIRAIDTLENASASASKVWNANY